MIWARGPEVGIELKKPFEGRVVDHLGRGEFVSIQRIPSEFGINLTGTPPESDLIPLVQEQRFSNASFDSPREGQARSHPVAHKDTERLWLLKNPRKTARCRVRRLRIWRDSVCFVRAAAPRHRLDVVRIGRRVAQNLPQFIYGSLQSFVEINKRVAGPE